MVKYILRIDDVYRFMDIEVLRRLKELDAPLVLGVTPNWKLKQRNGKKRYYFDKQCFLLRICNLQIL